MEREILGVYNTHFGYQLVQITKLVSNTEERQCYETMNLITSKVSRYYGYELWPRKLDPAEYMANITSTLVNK